MSCAPTLPVSLRVQADRLPNRTGSARECATPFFYAPRKKAEVFVRAARRGGGSGVAHRSSAVGRQATGGEWTHRRRNGGLRRGGARTGTQTPIPLWGYPAAG